MTLDELTYASRTKYPELESWRMLGLFGDRWKEPRDRGCWRHVTKLVAHRAVIMRALLDAGLTRDAAMKAARSHEVKDRDKPLLVHAQTTQITLWRDTLPLP